MTLFHVFVDCCDTPLATVTADADDTHHAWEHALAAGLPAIWAALMADTSIEVAEWSYCSVQAEGEEWRQPATGCWLIDPWAEVLDLNHARFEGTGLTFVDLKRLYTEARRRIVPTEADGVRWADVAALANRMFGICGQSIFVAAGKAGV